MLWLLTAARDEHFVACCLDGEGSTAQGLHTTHEAMTVCKQAVLVQPAESIYRPQPCWVSRSSCAAAVTVTVVIILDRTGRSERNAEDRRVLAPTRRLDNGAGQWVIAEPAPVRSPPRAWHEAARCTATGSAAVRRQCKEVALPNAVARHNAPAQPAADLRHAAQRLRRAACHHKIERIVAQRREAQVSSSGRGPSHRRAGETVSPARLSGPRPGRIEFPKSFHLILPVDAGRTKVICGHRETEKRWKVLALGQPAYKRFN
eukprot:COSAG06_NODE_137_length_22365_cov_49.346313_12_plen_261_part_00